MEIVYGKRFSKDLDAIRHESKIKADLLKVLKNIREADSLADQKDVRKIEGEVRFLVGQDVYNKAMNIC